LASSFCFICWTYSAICSGVFSPIIIDWIPLSNASITAEDSDMPQVLGCVVESISSANWDKISGILFRLSLLEGRLLVASAR